MIQRATGLLRATEAQRGAVRLYGVGAMPDDPALSYPIQQDIARLIDQESTPACAGCTGVEVVEAVLGVPPNLSWVRLWTDARRRDGNITRYGYGTYFTSVIDSLVNRGLDVEEPGERNRVEEFTQPDDLDSEMNAADRRQFNTERWRLPDGDLDTLDAALSRGLGVGIATGVKDPYFKFFSTARSPAQADVVLGTAALGGDTNGHEQRIVAVEKTSSGRVYTIQNSWGLFGGCHLPDGTFRHGLARVSEAVLINAWDVDCIRIQKRV